MIMKENINPTIKVYKERFMYPTIYQLEIGEEYEERTYFKESFFIRKERWGSRHVNQHTCYYDLSNKLKKHNIRIKLLDTTDLKELKLTLAQYQGFHKYQYVIRNYKEHEIGMVVLDDLNEITKISILGQELKNVYSKFQLKRLLTQLNLI